MRRPEATTIGRICAISLLAVLAGCRAAPVNPSFCLSVDEARDMLDTMKADPRELERPVIVLGGWIDPGVVTSRLKRQLCELCDDDRIMGVSFAFQPSFDSCRQRLLTFMDDRFPADDPRWTAEVDVIAVSMGGLIARYAALPSPEGGPRLRIARLFTIATPHQGAQLAPLPTWDRLQIDMRADSAFLRKLDESPPDYPVFSYVRLDDLIVGAENAGLPGETAWWVPNQSFQFAHAMASRDPRILADIMLRLRDEPPVAVHPPEPLPGS